MTDEAWARIEVMAAERRQLVGQLEAFIRYRHRLGSTFKPQRENWDARGPDKVWMTFWHDGGEVRFSAPYDAFEDWRAAA